VKGQVGAADPEEAASAEGFLERRRARRDTASLPVEADMEGLVME
jgi:hypothetical protein